MLTFNNQGMPIYKDPAEVTTMDIKCSVLEAEAKQMESTRNSVESQMKAELEQAEESIRDKYRAKYGTSIVGETKHDKAMRDFVKRVRSSF